MGRLDPKYTQAQKQALTDLVLKERLNVRQAVTRLETDGHGDVEPFTIPYEYARKIIARKRSVTLGELASGDITTAIDQLVRRGIDWADTQLEQGNDDADKVSKVFKTLVDIDKLAKANRPTGRKKNQTVEETPEPDAMQRLATQLGNAATQRENGHNTHDEHTSPTAPNSVS